MAYIPSPNISKSISSKNKLKLSDIREDKPKTLDNSLTGFIQPPSVKEMDEKKRQELSAHNRFEFHKKVSGVRKTNYSLQEITNRLENAVNKIT